MWMISSTMYWLIANWVILYICFTLSGLHIPTLPWHWMPSWKKLENYLKLNITLTDIANQLSFSHYLSNRILISLGCAQNACIFMINYNMDVDVDGCVQEGSALPAEVLILLILYLWCSQWPCNINAGWRKLLINIPSSFWHFLILGHITITIL